DGADAVKVGRVIGRVTLSRPLESLEGGRWLVVSPMDRRSIEAWNTDESAMSPSPSVVVYDEIGGWNGDIIAYSEGREAAMPFDQPTPIDAYNCALIEDIDYRPQT